jgi:hypothetical protein
VHQLDAMAIQHHGKWVGTLHTSVGCRVEHSIL